jgi:hypothetical protein
MFPPGRYGRRREPATRRRWIMPVALTAVILLCGTLAFKLYQQYGRPRFTPTVVNISGVTATSVTVRLVVRKPGGEAAICTLDALADDQSIIGTAEVPVPAGTSVTLTYTVSTTGKARWADIPSCRAAS